MSQDFGWPQPAPSPTSRWRPAPGIPPAFDAAASIERIRQAQQQAALEQAASQQPTADEVLDATTDIQTREGVDAWRQFKADSGQLADASDPVEPVLNWSPNQHGPLRNPGALSAEQIHQQWFDGVKDWATSPTGLPMTASVLGQRAQYHYGQGVRQQQELDSNSRQAAANHPAPEAGQRLLTEEEPYVPPTMPDQAAAGKGLEKVMKDAAAQSALPTDGIPSGPPTPSATPVPAVSDRGVGRRKAAADQRNLRSRQRQDRWTDPTELKPLPGEETLPKSVTGWAGRSASSDPVGRLGRAYEAEVANWNNPDAPPPSFDEWLDSKGVSADTPPEEAEALLEKIVSDNMVEFPNHGGKGSDPRVDKDDDTVLVGRTGVADDTPLDLMTDDQKKSIGTDQFGRPRTARGGSKVWDQTARDGEGGFVPRGVQADRLQAAKDAADRGDYRKAAALMGIDHMAYGDNIPTLAGDVRAELDRHDRMIGAGYVADNVAGGGVRYKAGEGRRRRDDEMKRGQSMRTMASRWAKEMKDSGVSAQEMDAAYQSAYERAFNGGSRNPHAEAMRSVNQRFVNDFRLRQAQNQKLAYQQNQDQYSRSVRFGLPKAIVAGLDTVGNAQTVQDKANALMVMHAQQPGMGWDQMAGMLMRGDMDARALDKWVAGIAGKPSPFTQHQANIQRITSSPITGSTFAELGALASQEAGPQATNEQRQVIVRRYTQPMVSSVMRAGRQPTAEELDFVRMATAGMNYDEFCNFVGINTRDPDSKKKYHTVTGKGVGFRGEDAMAVGSSVLGGIGGAIGWGLNAMLTPSRSGTAMAVPPSQKQ